MKYDEYLEQMRQVAIELSAYYKAKLSKKEYLKLALELGKRATNIVATYTKSS